MTLDPRLVARALGGTASGRHVYAPGPGHSKDDRSLSILIDPAARDGFLVTSFADDDWRECRDYIKERLGLPRFGNGRIAAPSRPPPPAAPAADERWRTEQALRIWVEARSAAGTLVEAYLAARGLHLPPDVAAAGALRFHAACPFAGARLPVMLALMRDVRTDEPRAVHRTALLPDGSGKAAPPDGGNAKRMLGPAGGTAIKLCPDEAVTYGLGVSEGIETALAVILAGWRPVWAVGSAGAIKGFPALPGLDALTIFADPDDVGQAAAMDAGGRLSAEGLEVEILAPPGAGDWHDRLTGRAAA